MNLDELRSQLAGRVALLPVIGALILGVQLSGLRQEISVESVAVMVGFLVLSGGAALLMRSHPRLGASLGGVGPHRCIAGRDVGEPGALAARSPG